VSARGLSLVCAFTYPGKYALTALAGAVESAVDLSDVQLFFPRDTQSLIATVRERESVGDFVLAAFSFYSPSFPESVAMLRALEAAAPGKFVSIAGGVHATAETEQTLGGGFDLVCVGEGERALIELLRRAKAGLALEEAPGFAFRRGGATVRTAKPAMVEVLDAFPPFAARAGHFGPIEITRGCIYACRFCQTPFMSKARFRHRSVENVRLHVREMLRQGRDDVRFISPTSLSYGAVGEEVNLAAVEALLAGVREEAGASGRIFFGTFPSEVRPEHVTPEALAVLKRYVSNDNLVIGGQSGSLRVLESSRRGHDVEAIVRAVEVANAGGFLANVDFILGLPGEAADDMRATVELMQKLAERGAKVHSHTFMPLPGTPFRDAPPGDVPSDARLALEQLASKQALYGQWQKQIEIARELAERRQPRASISEP
jgi:B12-binding domain/radical SAM domain protein